MQYPKRLIEIDLPIKRISANARHEKKSAVHGHLTTLHIWWARRPLAACRAILCASLWVDPADPNCSDKYVNTIRSVILDWSKTKLHLLSASSYSRFQKIAKKPNIISDKLELRSALLDIIADFSDPNNANSSDFISTAKKITVASHFEIDHLESETPFVIDPFAGGGAIPLEAARIGAHSFASDLNPIPVILNKILLEFLPKARTGISELVKKYGLKILDSTKKEIEQFYPKLQDGSVPVAYIWARTISCEGPGCGATVPLIKSLWLQKKGKIKKALLIKPDSKKIRFEIIENPRKVGEGTIKKGNVVCPCCGYTTSVHSVRRQLKSKDGGANDAMLVCVVSSFPKVQGRLFSIPTENDFKTLEHLEDYAAKKINSIITNEGQAPLDIELPLMSGVFNAPIYGIDTWKKLYTNRQFITLLILSEKISGLKNDLEFNKLDSSSSTLVKLSLALVHSKLADLANSLCAWESNASCVQHLFGRQAIQMTWDFAEGNILGTSRGSWLLSLGSIVKVIENNYGKWGSGQVEKCSATNHILPDDIANAVVTDPPYYNAVPYADLSDFFYVWLRRTIGSDFPNLFEQETSPKEEEICEMAGWDSRRYSHKDSIWYENQMRKAMEECRRLVKPSGIGVVVFAHKSTAGWEAQLQAMLDAGWIFTASWPIDTELDTRLRGMKSAALASSIHLVCRPRENEDGLIIQNQIGDWRDVQTELPKRIHEWMPRLAAEGVAGADAIFACLGPALEIFSRYSSVEKPNGDVVTLREYLEKVWAAVSQEALNMVFEGGDAQGMEEDARLTAMWLWTLTAGASDNTPSVDEEDFDDEESSGARKLTGGFTLEYDTARKIAQGLGANLEELKTLIEVKGDKARLLPVLERANKLFGLSDIQQQSVKRKKKDLQLSLFSENMESEKDSKYEMPELKVEQTGKSVLDRLHQAMLLFSSGRTDALKRFLVEDGAGKDDRFWKLAQSLTSLYPKDTNERRWVEAVQTYKKSLGF